MANPPCMNDDGNQAVMIATNLDTGDSAAVCVDCLAPWAAAILTAVTGRNAEEFLYAGVEGRGGAEEPAPDEPPPDKSPEAQRERLATEAGKDAGAGDSPPTS